MPWTPTSFFAIRDANGEQLRTIDTFLDMGKAHRRARPAGAPGHGRRDAVGEHDRGGPRRRRAVRRPLRRAQRARRPRPAVHDADRAGARTSSPGCPASTAPAPTATARGAPTPTPSAPASSARRTCRSTIRRDWVMNANDSYWLPNPEQPLEGYAADHRLRAVRAHAAHPDGRPLRHGRAGQGQGSARPACAASSTRTG